MIAVCGVPGAGKTTLARGVGAALHLPVVVRDDLKTGVAATRPDIDWSDPEVRARVGGQAFDDFHRVIDAYLDAGSSVVAEAAWHWGVARERLAPRFARSCATIVHVTVDRAVAAARYRARFEAGERHPSHHDGAFADEMDADGYDWQRYLPPADLGMPIVTVDGNLPPADVLTAALAAVGEP